MNQNMLLIALVVGALFFLRRPTGNQRPVEGQMETVILASQAGVPTEGFWDRPALETGAWF
jgi:hypothetical protein